MAIARSLTVFGNRRSLGQIYRTEYFAYRQQVGGELQAESIDRQVAKLILQEYLSKFRSVTIAKIESILSHGDKPSCSTASTGGTPATAS